MLIVKSKDKDENLDERRNKSQSPVVSTRHRDKSTHKRRRSSKRRHRHRSKDHRHRKRRRSSRRHKKKKRVSRKESACSPSYSDYEPENPILRLRAKVKNNVLETSAARVKEQKREGQTDSSQQQKLNGSSRRRTAARSFTRSPSTSSSRSRSRSRSRKRKSRSRSSAKKKKHKRSKGKENIRNEPSSSQEKDDSSVQILKNPKDGKIYPKHLPKRMLLSLDGGSDKEAETKGEEQDGSLDIPIPGKIVITSIDDIPTSPTPKETTPDKKFEKNSFISTVSSNNNNGGTQTKKIQGPKLSFEINQNKKGKSDEPQNGRASTFAELSKKLEEKKIKNKKKNGVFKNAFVEKGRDDGQRKLPPLQDHIQTIKGDLDYDVVDIDDELEESFKTFKDQEKSTSQNSRSKTRSPSTNRRRSRSRSASRSRSRSSSGRSSYTSRSRSRSYSTSRSSSAYSSATRSRSRSRSRSYSYSSRSRSVSSRSRTRSPSKSLSIPRRRGSPSFLDRRRITSARKRPIPYKRRPLASPTPSGSSCDEDDKGDITPPLRRKITASPKDNDREELDTSCSAGRAKWDTPSPSPQRESDPYEVVTPTKAAVVTPTRAAVVTPTKEVVDDCDSHVNNHDHAATISWEEDMDIVDDD